MSSVASQLSGTPALAPRQSLPSSVLRSGTASIALLATDSADILDSRVSDSSVILAQAEGLPYETSVCVAVQKTAGKSFKFVADAAPTTNPISLRYAILQY
jgi:hypothetical protein